MTGAELREARQTRKMSTQMIADLVGVHRDTVARWERSAQIPNHAHASLRWILGASKPPATAGLNAQKGKADTA